MSTSHDQLAAGQTNADRRPSREHGPLLTAVNASDVAAFWGCGPMMAR